MSVFEIWTAFLTIVTKEIRRYLRIWPPTLLPPAITMSLYFVIFGALIGSRIGEMGGFSYMEFVVPGLIMMSVVTNSSVPESTLKKKSNSIAYHYVRSKIAAGIGRVAYEPTGTNLADMLTKIAKGEILRLVEIHKDESGIILHIAVPIDRSADTTGAAQDANTRTKIEATRNSAKAIHKARTKAKIAAKAANENIEPNEVTKVDIATKTEDNAKSEGTKRNTAGHRAEAEFETTFAGGMTSSIVGSSNTTSTAQIKKQMIQPILLCR